MTVPGTDTFLFLIGSADRRAGTTPVSRDGSPRPSASPAPGDSSPERPALQATSHKNRKEATPCWCQRRKRPSRPSPRRSPCSRPSPAAPPRTPRPPTRPSRPSRLRLLNPPPRRGSPRVPLTTGPRCTRGPTA
ncbi:hypothetical protein SD72_01025 [Leucobacter komagatae]|uniref:Uncharacterized protein n=1 Tax=Leucobacter komagatae TaxID=55969 RepID=A0A0D0IQD1_9MICO|nr:hypothetical protein SD72_01025 [Leucobacter komagatae]